MGGVAFLQDMRARVGSVRRRHARGSRPGIFLENRREARRAMVRGGLALERERPAEAERQAVAALLAAPGWLEPLAFLGTVLDAQGRTELALVCHRGQVPDEIWEAHIGRTDAVAPCRVSSGTSRRTPVHGTERCSLPAPGGVADPPPGLFARDAILAAPTWVDRVTDGRLWQDAHGTLVLDGRARALEEHTLGSPRLMHHLMAAHEPVSLGARAFVLGARGSGNYYHWMTDILPKLELCRLAGYRFGPEDRFVLPARRSAFQIDSLARFGIAERQIHFANRASPYVAADELVVPHLCNAMATSMGSWVPEFLKRTFLPPGERASGTRRIFVSRDPARSQGRDIANLEEASERFATWGFEIVFPERLSLDEQAVLFAESAVVAAPHGAGLANIVFCPPGTRVLEFYGAHLAPCYRAISALAGLVYHAHCCLDGVPEQDEHARARSLVERRTAGFEIDLDAARALLDLAGVG